MRRVLVFGAFLAACLPVLPESALAQKAAKPTTATSRVATAQEYTLIGQYGTVNAKLQSLDPGTGTVSFTIEASHPTLQKKTGTTTSSRSKRGSSGVTVKIEKEEISFECKVKKDAPLRKKELGSEYDSRGEIKTYSAEEKAKLKGKNSSLPGYMATMDDLKPGSYVQISLTSAPSVSQKVAQEDPLKARPSVKMVMLLPDPDMATQKAAAVPAKKKN